MGNYKVMVKKYGFADIKAKTEDAARRKTDKMDDDEFSWAERDWKESEVVGSNGTENRDCGLVNTNCMNPECKPNGYDDVCIFIPQRMQIVRISMGCSIGLSEEDEDQGYVDYIYYQQYDVECELTEDDGGEILLKEDFNEKYGCTADAIPDVIDEVYGDPSLKYMILSQEIGTN